MAVKACFCLFLFNNSRVGVQQTETSPVLNTGGEWIHTGGDSTNGETGLNNRVRMEKHGLDNIQNICVSVYVGRNIYKWEGKLIHSCECWIWITIQLHIQASFKNRYSECSKHIDTKIYCMDRDEIKIIFFIVVVFWNEIHLLYCISLDFKVPCCIKLTSSLSYPGESTNRRGLPPGPLWLSRKPDKYCWRWEAEKLSQLSGAGSYTTHLQVECKCNLYYFCLCSSNYYYHNEITTTYVRLKRITEKIEWIKSLSPSTFLVQLDEEVAESILMAPWQSSDDGNDNLFTH